MKRLYQKIYLTMIVALFVALLVAGAIWWIASGERRQDGADKLGVLIGAALPAADLPRRAQQRGLAGLSAKLNLKLALYDQSGQLIAASGAALDAGHRTHDLVKDKLLNRRTGWRHGVLTLRLPDGRYLESNLSWRKRPPAAGLLAFLASVALVVALCAYPVVRGLTRRLEQLQKGVEVLGGGDFKTRVKVEGRDEVARLAISFNEAAARIETLLGAHRQLLANASHELRTPLARLTMGIELAGEQIAPARRVDLRRDLKELDDLIEEILTASRLESLPQPETSDLVDLLGLAAEECANYDQCNLHGQMVGVQGDARLLRRLIRNLIENAWRYGQPPIDVSLVAQGGNAVLDVIDGGPGIAPGEHENVFEPFYRIKGGSQMEAVAPPLDREEQVPTGRSQRGEPGSGREGLRSSAGLGLGLGLALVRQIARLHGGEASIVARDQRPPGDRRNRIRVILPLVSRS